MPGRRGPLAAALVGAVALLATAGCTATSVDPQRARTVVMTVDVPFGSLNAATTAGRTPGSTLVRGLVQDRFMALDETGSAVPDPAVGTVQKVSDDPLTVRYTIAPTARWSDGVPVTGDDLLLEWAARSGQLDEVATSDTEDGSEQAGGATASSSGSTGTPSVAGTAAASTVPAPSGGTPSGAPSVAADLVSFGAVSPVLVHAPAVPTVDEHGLTLVYADPVADWQTALDVNLPAHVVGRLALGGSTTAAPTTAAPTTQTGSDTASPTSSGAPTSQPSAAASSTGAAGAADAAHWSGLVTAAIQHADHAALVPVSRVWRTAADAGALHGDLASAVTTGPYRVAAVDPGKRVELVRNPAYAGGRPAAYDRVVIRSDLDPVAQVAALRSGSADVVAPVDTSDVRSALQKIANVRLSTGGGAVLQLQLQESGGGVFDPTRWASGGDDGRARAAALRAALVAAVDRQRLAAIAGGAPSDAVLAGVGARTGTATPGSAPATTSSAAATSAAPAPTSAGATSSADGVAVRVLVSTDDQVRKDMLAALTQQLSTAGFTVTQAKPANPATALWADPGSWDVALVPVPQSSSPVASAVARWRTGGATNVTAHRDPTLDALLDAASHQTDPAAVPAALTTITAALTASEVVVPLVRQPVLAATVGTGSATAPATVAPADRPAVPEVPAIPWGSADLTSWWSWASTTR